MVYFFYLIIFINCWGPILHYVVSRDFIKEFFYNRLTKDQEDNFLLGSMYIDGLPKDPFHNIKFLNEMLINSTDQGDYWFKLGMLLHISCDFHAHQGNDISFIPLGSWHHFSEMIIDLYLMKRNNRIVLPKMSKEGKNILKGYISKKYYVFIIYKFLVTTFNIFKVESLLKYVSCGKCLKYYSDKEYSESFLIIHMDAMKKAMWETLLLFHRNNLTRDSVAQVSLNELNIFTC